MGKEAFSKRTTDGAVDYSEVNKSHILGTGRDPVPMCKEFLRKCCCVALGFVSCV